MRGIFVTLLMLLITDGRTTRLTTQRIGPTNPSDSGHAKRVLTYWEKWGNHDYSQINVSIVPMENYMLLERRGFPLSENIHNVGPTNPSEGRHQNFGEIPYLYYVNIGPFTPPLYLYRRISHLFLLLLFSNRKYYHIKVVQENSFRYLESKGSVFQSFIQW